MRHFLQSWSMLPWSRRHTVVLLIAMVLATALLLMATNFAGGRIL